MRRRFGKIINELAKKDDKIILLVGDIGYGVFDEFRKERLSRYIKRIKINKLQTLIKNKRIVDFS